MGGMGPLVLVPRAQGPQGASQGLVWAPGARGPRGVPSVAWGTRYYKVPLALGAPGVPCGAPWAGNLGYRWAYLGSRWPGLPFGPFGLWGAPAPAL